MKVTFIPGIDSISGSFKGKNGSRTVFMHRKSDKKGDGRVYFRKNSDYARKDPPTDNERAARLKFAQIAETVHKMTDEQKQQYALEMKKAKNRFNGKTYATLRGYIMARLYAEDPDSIVGIS